MSEKDIIIQNLNYKLDVIDAPEEAGVPGGVIAKVKIQNNSNNVLSSNFKNPIFVSYHVYNKDESLRHFEGTRSRLQKDIAPGESLEMDVVIDLSESVGIGEYIVEFLVLQEGKKWFDADESSENTISIKTREQIKNQEKLEKYVSEKLVQDGIDSVIYGPLKGLKYPSFDSVGSVLLAKILGTYEAELHDVVAEMCKKDYKTIIDIGAAEGYYAVGLSTHLKDAKMVAFEGDEKGRNLCKQMGEANGVADRLQIKGYCEKEDLIELAKEKKSGLIFCDAEGSELNILDEESIEYLKNFDLLIELHDASSSGPTISQIMQSRFEKTHNITFINVRRFRPVSHLSFLGLNNKEFEMLLAENRYISIGWMYLKSKEN